MDKILIGTRLEEEELNKHQNFYNQKAVNEKGHKRFHGAFTGGFSAGFKGTVGSEEGFVPKSFTSSKQKRADQGQVQSISDYMDEEDLGGHVIGANLTTRDEFDSFSDVKNNIVSKQLGTSILGKAPSELIVDHRKTIGWEILANIQYKKKKREQKKKQNNWGDYEKEEEENDMELALLEGELDLALLEKQYLQKKDKFDSMENYQIKQDFWGIGCCRGEGDSSVAEDEFNRLMKRSYMTQEEIEEEKEKKKEKNRIYTDFKKQYNYDEDEEDDYNQSIKEQEYEDTEVLPDKIAPKQIQTSSKIMTKGLDSLVVKDSCPFLLEIKSSQILVPTEYNPYKRMQEYIRGGGKLIEFQKQKKKFERLNAVQRKAILEDQLEMDKIKEQIETKKFVKAKEEIENANEEEKNSIFSSWEAEKQQRYRSWVEEKEGKGIFIQVQIAQLMSYKEMKNEQKEFAKLYKEIQEKKGVSSSNSSKSLDQSDSKKSIMDKIEALQAKLDHLKNFRKKEPWLPDKLLCKRFGVVPPYQDKAYFDKKMAEFKKIQEKEEQMQVKEFKIQQSESEIPENLGLPTEFKSNKYGLIQYKRDENDMDLEEYQVNNKNANEESLLYDVKNTFEETRMMREEQIKQEQKLIDSGEGEIEREIKFKEKPPIQLFKSIFGDEEEEEDENDDAI